MVRFFGHYLSYSSIVLVLVETSMFIAILAGLRVQDLIDGFDIRGGSGVLLLAETAFGLINFLILSAAGYYNRASFYSRQERWRSAIISFPVAYIGLCAIVTVVELLGNAHFTDYYKNFLVGLTLFSAVSILWRGGFRGAVDLDLFRRKVLVIGDEKSASEISSLAERTVHSGFRVVGFLSKEPCDGPLDKTIHRLPLEILQTRHALAKYASANQIDEIIVAYREQRRPKGELGLGLPVWELLECRLLGIRISNLHEFWEMETGRINLDELRPSSLIFSHGFRFNTLRNTIKRAFDFFCSTVLLLVFAPFMVATALAVKFTSPGPIFYMQERVGLRGAPFRLIKFRSMTVDAEKDGVPKWAGANDSRVTSVGAFIRKTRFDELPQLFNVFKGEMSLVGPRPERPYFVDELKKDIPFYDERHNLRPGITGWAQINYPYGASVEDSKIKLSYDIYYLKNHSLFLDIIIVLQTVGVMLFARGGR